MSEEVGCCSSVSLVSDGSSRARRGMDSMVYRAVEGRGGSVKFGHGWRQKKGRALEQLFQDYDVMNTTVLMISLSITSDCEGLLASMLFSVADVAQFVFVGFADIRVRMHTQEMHLLNAPTSHGTVRPPL